MALLEHRNAPTAIIDSSPNLRLFGRATRTLLPINAEKLQPQYLETSTVITKLKKRMNTQKLYYDNHSHHLIPLKKADQVWVQATNPNDKSWERGTIIQRLDNRSYRVRIGDRVYRRNRIHLRKADDVEEEQNEDDPTDVGETPEPINANEGPPQNVEIEGQERQGFSSRGRTIRRPVWHEDYEVEIE